MKETESRLGVDSPRKIMYSTALDCTMDAGERRELPLRFFFDFIICLLGDSTDPSPQD